MVLPGSGWSQMWFHRVSSPGRPGRARAPICFMCLSFGGLLSVEKEWWCGGLPVCPVWCNCSFEPFNQAFRGGGTTPTQSALFTTPRAFLTPSRRKHARYWTANYFTSPLARKLLAQLKGTPNMGSVTRPSSSRLWQVRKLHFMIDRHTLTYESVVVEGKVGKVSIGHRIVWNRSSSHGAEICLVSLQNVFIQFPFFMQAP